MRWLEIGGVLKCDVCGEPHHRIAKLEREVEGLREKLERSADLYCSKLHAAMKELDPSFDSPLLSDEWSIDDPIDMARELRAEVEGLKGYSCPQCTPMATRNSQLIQENEELRAEVERWKELERARHAAMRESMRQHDETIIACAKHLDEMRELRAEIERLIRAYDARKDERDRVIARLADALGALRGILKIVDESRGVDGWHLNDDIAHWDEFDEVEEARAALRRAGREG
jgi:DNA repair exonuclease SbcCD ATPase subunit